MRAADTDLLEGLFRTHYVRLVRVAVLLLRDPGQAEDVVQDAYVGMHAALPRLADPDAAAGYLHRSVVNGCRSRLRHRAVALRHKPGRQNLAPSAEDAMLGTLVDAPLTAAIRALPRGQREAVLLRHYLDLSEVETAAALGIRVGSVKSATSRGLAALRGLVTNEEKQ